MRLTADKLELYDIVGRGVAAREISKAVNAAIKLAIREIGSRYPGNQVAAERIAAVIQQHVWPVMRKHAEMGAVDSEPMHACRSTICKAVAERYELRVFDLNDLRDRL